MAINLFGLSIPQISLPSLPKIEVPKIEIPEPPKIEIPKITVPDVTRVIPKIVTSPVPVAAVAGAVGSAAASLPKVDLPKVTLPKVDLPKVTLPKVDLTKAAAAISLPVAAGSVVAGAVQGGTLPKIDLPKISLPDLSSVPGLGLVSGAGAAAASAVQRGDLPKITLPDVSKVTLPPLPGLDILSGAASIARGEMPKANVPQPLNDLGGWVSQGIDGIIGARDQSYEDSISHLGAGNVPRGGGQFAATAAADVILPLDLLDAGNKWMTGRGDQIDGELALWAAIDAVSLAAAPFTFGASYAAGRALKAGKVAAKTAKIGGDMGKTTAITKLVSGLSGAGKTTRAVKPAVKVPTTAARSTADITTAMRKQAGAARAAYAKQIAEMQKTVTKAVSGLKPASAAKTSTALGKTGTALKYTGLGLGTGAIGLTALGALGAPAPQEIPEGGDGGGGALGGGDQVTGAGDDWWTEFMNSLYGGEAYDPSLYEGYDPYAGYYDPGYPDVLGVEPYAQDLLTYAEEIPVVGGVATAAKQSGFALPLIVGAIILVVLAVAFLRSKKGKAMVSGAKKKVSSAAKGAKKAVGA